MDGNVKYVPILNKQALAKQLLEFCVLKLVGSVLIKNDPRDIDIAIVIPDELFQEHFGNQRDFIKAIKSGNWNANTHKWSDISIEISKLLCVRLKSSLPIDAKVTTEYLSKNLFTK